MKTAQLVSTAAALVATSVALPSSSGAVGQHRQQHPDSSPLHYEYPSGLRHQDPVPVPEFRPHHSHSQEDQEASPSPPPSPPLSLVDLSVDYIRTGLQSAVDAAEDITQKLHGHLTEAVDALPLPTGGDHDFPDRTIYELISLSNYTTRFYKLVSEFPDIVEILNSTDASYTLFVPIDSAFDDIPDHHHHHHDGDDGDDEKKRAFAEALVKYHVGLDVYNVRRLLTTRTLPTALNEKLLGDEAQRLRASIGLGGVRLNFYSRVVAADIGAKNGIIHGVAKILLPPPPVGRLISLFPGEFSTLLLAYEKTDFSHFIHNVTTVGGTLFAPSNSAFARLGPRANAFLFNSEKGLKYLGALLKYHIAPNATLYSDAFYDERGKSHAESDEEFMAQGREHFDLETLLGTAHVGVDIATFAAFRTIRVNGFSYVSIADGLGRDGVVQVIDKVLIPPYKHKENSVADGPIEVEELIERLDGYIH